MRPTRAGILKHSKADHPADGWDRGQVNHDSLGAGCCSGDIGWVAEIDATHGGWHWNRAIINDRMIRLIPGPPVDIKDCPADSTSTGMSAQGGGGGIGIRPCLAQYESQRVDCLRPLLTGVKRGPD